MSEPARPSRRPLPPLQTPGKVPAPLPPGGGGKGVAGRPSPPPRVLLVDLPPADPDDDDWLPPNPLPRRRRVRALVVVALMTVLAGGAWVVFANLEPPSAGPVAAAVPIVPTPSLPAPPAAAPAAVAPARPAPAAPSGTLVVNAIPWAELYLNGRLVGTTPITGLAVPAGGHRLRFVRDGFEPEERVVVVAPGQTLRVTGVTLREVRP